MRLNYLMLLTILSAIVLAATPVLLSVTGFNHGAFAQNYLTGFLDVPVMEGLQVIDDAGIEFDAPSGRIAEAYAVGKLSREVVFAFYKVTLQQLGWSKIDAVSFEREGEMLRLDFNEFGDELTVHFQLQPTGTDSDSAKPVQSN